jgi:hypothetical protein
MSVLRPLIGRKPDFRLPSAFVAFVPEAVSRWSFHTACIDPTAPADARCRKNVVVRSFVFF